MTRPDDTPASPRPRPILAQLLIYIGLCLVFGAMGAGGMLGAREGVSFKLVLIVGVLSAIGAIATFMGARIGNFEPLSLSTRAGRSQVILLASAMFGGLVSIYLMHTGAYDRMVDGEFTPSPMEAGVALAVLYLVLLPIGFFWQRNIDEHEDAAVKTAAYAAFGSYMYLYLGWAIAAAAGWVPEVHDFGLFIAVVFIFAGVWVVKRAG